MERAATGLSQANLVANEIVSSTDWCVLERNAPLRQAGAVIGLGGGSVMDVARLRGMQLGAEVTCVPSVLSTDAFLTSTTAVRVRGRVRYLPSGPATTVVIDEELLLQAPAHLNALGCCDVLSILTASEDWRRDTAACHSEAAIEAGLQICDALFAAQDEIAAGSRAPVPADTRHVSFDVFDIYYRTAVGRAMANETGFSELTATLDTKRYDIAFAAWSLWQAGLELARARQRAEEDRLEAAFFSARLGLRHTVTAMMTRLGYGWPNPKWAFVKLARHYGRESAEYQRAWQLNGLGVREGRDYVREVASFCEEQGAPFLIPAPPESTVYAWRGEATEVSIAGRTYLVYGRKDVFEMDEAAAYLCSMVDSLRPLREISAFFAERFELQAQIASYRTGEMLQQLSAAGVLKRRDEFVSPEEVDDGGA